MKNWLEQVGFWDMNGTLATTAGLLLLLLAGSVPKERRRVLRQPAAAFALYVLLLAYAQTFAGKHGAWVRVAAFTTALVSLGRSALLIATETRVGRWLLPPLPRIFVDVLNGLILGLVVLATLYAAGFEPGELLTTSALITAVIGLALQDTLGNLFAGLSLQLGRQFDVGDWIDVDADPLKNGRVVEIGWRATKVVNSDAVEIVVPNGVISKSPVRVYSRPVSMQRRRIPFGCDYAVPPARVAEVVLAAMRDVEQVLAQPAPDVVTRAFGDSAMMYELRYWTEEHAAVAVVDSRVIERIWHALSRARIAIPFPQRDVHVHQHDEARSQRLTAERRKERLAALANVPVLARLPADYIEDLANDATERTYAPGEDIVRQGEEGSELFVVISGSVNVLAGDPPRVLASLASGGFFGEMSLLTGERRNATVRATAVTRVVVVGHDGISLLLRNHPEVDARLSELLAERQLQLEEARGGLPSEEGAADLQARSGVILRRIRSFFS